MTDVSKDGRRLVDTTPNGFEGLPDNNEPENNEALTTMTDVSKDGRRLVDTTPNGFEGLPDNNEAENNEGDVPDIVTEKAVAEYQLQIAELSEEPEFETAANYAARMESISIIERLLRESLERASSANSQKLPITKNHQACNDERKCDPSSTGQSQQTYVHPPTFLVYKNGKLSEASSAECLDLICQGRSASTSVASQNSKQDAQLDIKDARIKELEQQVRDYVDRVARADEVIDAAFKRLGHSTNIITANLQRIDELEAECARLKKELKDAAI